MSGTLSPFSSVAILGPGLLGGSVALAVRRYLPDMEIRLWARRQAPLDEAAAMSITPHLFTDISSAVAGAELIILATPVGCFENLSVRMLPSIAPGALVTDVGSVKAYVHRTSGALLHAHGVSFIGSHPMAGSEKQGLSAACQDLFVGAGIVLTNDQEAPPELLNRLAAFWTALGGRCLNMEAGLHDRTVARISHVPHVLAALCARNAVADGNQKDLRELASTGFRDTTRVCSGAPGMWADILWENDVAVRKSLSSCVDDLRELSRLLETQDKAGVERWLANARSAREQILFPREK